MAERAERGLFIRSVAPVAEWLRWDGRAGWRWSSPQRDGGGQDQDQDQDSRASQGYLHRSVPVGWFHRHGASMSQIAPLISGQVEATGEATVGVGSRRVEGVRVSKTFLGRVSLHLGEVRSDPEGDVGGACFGQVSRRLGRFLKRLPKSRSWSDGLRILRRSSSNGSLLTNSGMEKSAERARAAWRKPDHFSEAFDWVVLQGGKRGKMIRQVRPDWL